MSTAVLSIKIYQAIFRGVGTARLSVVSQSLSLLSFCDHFGIRKALDIKTGPI